MNTKIQGNFLICISVPLNINKVKLINKVNLLINLSICVILEFLLLTLNMQLLDGQKCIQNSNKQLWWSFFTKIVYSFYAIKSYLQNARSKMFDRVLTGRLPSRFRKDGWPEKFRKICIFFSIKSSRPVAL